MVIGRDILDLFEDNEVLTLETISQSLDASEQEILHIFNHTLQNVCYFSNIDDGWRMMDTYNQFPNTPNNVDAKNRNINKRKDLQFLEVESEDVVSIAQNFFNEIDEYVHKFLHLVMWIHNKDTHALVGCNQDSIGVYRAITNKPYFSIKCNNDEFEISFYDGWKCTIDDYLYEEYDVESSLAKHCRNSIDLIIYNHLYGDIYLEDEQYLRDRIHSDVIFQELFIDNISEFNQYIEEISIAGSFLAKTLFGGSVKRLKFSSDLYYYYYESKDGRQLCFDDSDIRYYMDLDKGYNVTKRRSDINFEDCREYYVKALDTLYEAICDDPDTYEADDAVLIDEDIDYLCDKWDFDIFDYSTRIFDSDGYDQAGYDRAGYNRDGFNKRGINRNTGTKYNVFGYDILGYDKEGFDSNGFDRNGFNQEGYDIEGYNRGGYDRQGYDRKGFDKNGYDKRKFNKNKIHKETCSKYDWDGYDYYGFNAKHIHKDDK